MIKKEYMTPAVEEIELNLEATLLAGSDLKTNNDDNDNDDIEDL